MQGLDDRPRREGDEDDDEEGDGDAERREAIDEGFHSMDSVAWGDPPSLP